MDDPGSCGNFDRYANEMSYLFSQNQNFAGPVLAPSAGVKTHKDGTSTVPSYRAVIIES